MARYEDLLGELPRGSAYANSGYVLPFRDADQQFLFEDPAFPNQVYGVFVDDRFFGTVTSDAQGAVIVEVPLEPGPHVITIENDFNARRLNSYVTVRDYAVWYASYAEALEGSTTFFGIDPAIDSVERAPALINADAVHIEQTQGQTLRQPNDLGYVTDTYRTVLFGLRQGFRLYAVTPFGIAEAVAAFTNSLAYVVPRALRPTWFLNSQLAPNGTLDQRTHVAQSALPTLNQTTLNAVGSILATEASTTPTNPPTAQRLIVIFTSSWDGGNLTITGTDGAGTVISEVFTPTGTPVSGFINKLGAETFTTVTSITNSSIGTTGSATIGLTATAFVTVVEVEGSPIREGTTAAGVTYLTINDNSGERSLSYGPNVGGNNDNRVPIPVSGRYTVPYNAEGDILITPASPGGGYDFSDGAGERGRDRIIFNIANRGPITALLGVSGGLTGNTPINVVTDINSAFQSDNRYGASVASIVDSTSNLLGSAILIDSSITPTPGQASQSFLRLGGGCADAARELFGLPRYVGDATSAASAGATTFNYGASDRIGEMTAPFDARVGRGLLATGSGTVSNASGRFADFTGATLDLRVNECIRLESTTGGNAGLHTIIAVLGVDSWRLKHESVAGTFTNAAAQAYQAWILGDIVNVTDNDQVGNQFTIAAPGLPRDLPSGFQIELAGEVPFDTDPDRLEAPSNLIVDVNVDLTPPVATDSSLADDLSLAGQIIPDGWLVESGTNFAIKTHGLISESSFGIERDSTDIIFQTTVTGIVPTFEGFPIDVIFWVQQHNTASQNFRIDISFDGTTFSPGTPQAVPGTLEFDGATRRTRADPTRVERQVTVPRTATTFLVRLVHVGTSAGETISIERVIVTSNVTTSYWLGRNTVVRDTQVSNFGEYIYIWSPEPLTTAEDTTIGIDPGGEPRPTNQNNKIDLIGDAHGTLERFDISEYDVNNNPINVLGAHDDATWLNAALTNMEIVVGVPGRISYARPTRLSLIQNETLSPDAFGVATTTQPTTHLGPFPENPNGSFQLVEDGVPVPDTANASGVVPYVFTASDTLDIDASVFAPAATYTANYDVLIAAETAVIDLGADVADFLWLVDAYVWQAINQTLGTRTLTVGVTFFADFTATLATPSNQDQNQATLTADNGVTRTTVADADWSFVDQSTISINPNVFDANSLYELEYQSIFNVFVRQPTFTLQLRSAASPGAIPSATYTDTEINDALDNSFQYHQLRILLFGVQNLDDVRVHSLGVRGIRVFGATPNAPGIVIP